jgi:hypothetical protein
MVAANKTVVLIALGGDWSVRISGKSSEAKKSKDQSISLVLYFGFERWDEENVENTTEVFHLASKHSSKVDISPSPGPHWRRGFRGKWSWKVLQETLGIFPSFSKKVLSAALK